MSANFDWQTEEDSRRNQSVWDEPPETPGPSRQRRPRWRLIGLVAGLVVALGLLIWWRAAERIEATTQAVRTDVIASHNLVQRAAIDGDEEIFRSFLSGRDPAWTAGELEMFRQQLFVDRAPFGLTPAEGSLPAILSAPEAEAAAGERPADIQLSPNFGEAVVVIDQPFQSADGSTVVLQQTTVYRRGDQRWLLSPPQEEYWGEWQSAQGQYLRLIYPQRDETVAVALAEDLDAAIDRMCDTLQDIDCSADLSLTVRLDTDPGALAVLTQPLGALERALQTKDIVELPTPTLVGLPAGDNAAQREAGYEALRQGYTRHLLSAVIAQIAGWQCCDQKLLFQLLLEYQLSQLGLADWSVSEADYRLVLDEQLRLRDLGRSLHSDSPLELSDDQMRQARTAVDFLMHTIPDVSAAEMQRISNRAQSFSRFLTRIWPNAGEGESPIPDPDVAWWLYAYQGSLTPSEPPIAEAGEELYLACTTLGDTQRPDPSLFFHYLPEEQAWRELYRLDGFIWMSPLPGPRTLLLQEFILASEAWQTSIWRDGERVTAYAPGDSSYGISFGQTDPAGRRLVTYSFDPDEGLNNVFTIDLERCDGDCPTEPLPALPYWSPNGQWAIYAGSSQSYPENLLVTADLRYSLIRLEDSFRDEPLALGPGDATTTADLTDIGAGYAPFWLDETTYGYIRHLSSASSPVDEEEIAVVMQDNPTPRGSGVGMAGRSVDAEIVIATLDDPTPQTLITAADLEQFMPDDNRLRRLSLAYVAAHPAHPDLIFIVALDDLEQRAHVFAFDRTTGQAELRLGLLYNFSHSLSFSPDGRYLLLTGNDRASTTSNDNSGVLFLHDIAENRTVPFTTRLPFFLPSVVYDWTSDGRWLALALDDNLIGLVAPEEEYVRLLPHTYGACTSVAWLEP